MSTFTVSGCHSCFVFAECTEWKSEIIVKFFEQSVLKQMERILAKDSANSLVQLFWESG
jgi:hypothetical protein